MDEEMVSRVTWEEGKLALDLHIGEVVRVVVMGTFGNVHTAGVLQPADEAGPSDDHAFYKLVTEQFQPLTFTLTRNESATCEVTEEALGIEYDAAIVRVVWSDVETGGPRRRR